MKTIKVTIADGYFGHHHRGKECQPGDVIEVTEDQKEFLDSVGALAPEKSRTRKKSASKGEDETAEEPPADETTTED